MIKKLFLLPVILLGAMIVFSPSCGDKCPKDGCGNGICDEVDGTCNCDPGYEYDEDGICTVEARAKLIGEFSTSEKCDQETSSTPYKITIQNGTSISEVQIFNFFNAFTSTGVKATVDGSTLTIATQKPAGPSGTLEVSGTGTISTNASGKVEIAMNYQVYDTTLPNSATNPFKCSTTVFVKN